jgi:hypothetical protein
MHKTIITPADLAELASEQPTELELTIKTPCCVELMKLLPALLPTLEVFKVYGIISECIVPKICKMLAASTKLRTLALMNGALTNLESFTAAFAENTTLTHAYFYGNGIKNTTALCKMLKHNTTIKLIGLGNNKIKDVTMLCEALEHNTTLEWLQLHDNIIEDANPVARLLCVNKTLTHVSLDTNEIEDIDFLSCALAMNKTLEALGLVRNKIRDVKVLGDALKQNRALKYLGLSENSISGFETFTTNASLETLNIDENPLRCDCHAANIVRGFLKLKLLNLTNCGITRFDGLAEALGTTTTLKTLTIGDDTPAEAVKLLSSKKDVLHFGY